MYKTCRDTHHIHEQPCDIPSLLQPRYVDQTLSAATNSLLIDVAHDELSLKDQHLGVRVVEWIGSLGVTVSGGLEVNLRSSTVGRGQKFYHASVINKRKNKIGNIKTQKEV